MRTYTLTLTLAECRAIDWVGHRYAHGDDLYSLLIECEWTPEDASWSMVCEIAFTLDATAAYRLTKIRDEEDGRWPCFAPELARKLDDLCHAYEADHPNLDCQWADDLEAYANDKTHPEQLRHYAHIKALAMRARGRGDIPAALRRERRLEGLYDALPEWARW